MRQLQQKVLTLSIANLTRKVKFQFLVKNENMYLIKHWIPLEEIKNPTFSFVLSIEFLCAVVPPQSPPWRKEAATNVQTLSRSLSRWQKRFFRQIWIQFLIQFFRGEYFSGVNIFQAWIFYKGEHFCKCICLLSSSAFSYTPSGVELWQVGNFSLCIL